MGGPSIALIGGGGEGVSGTNNQGTRYTSMSMDDSDTTEEEAQQRVPYAGTMANFSVRLDTAPGTGDSYTFTVRDTGSNTALSCTISGSALSCTDPDSHAFAAGDLLSISYTEGGSPSDADIHWTASFEAS